MKDTVRCCISCILPCGALDVIRIIHSNGYVEEISGTIRAAEIMKLHPKHVLKKPSSPSYTDEGTVTCPQIIILPPEAELKRGKIYFLMPVPPSSLPEKTRTKSSSTTKKKKNVARNNNTIANNNETNNLLTNLLGNDRYLTEIMSEKVKDKRRGRVGVWRPHLESISEATSDV
ncbi:phosphatidylinositol 4-phosphate 5-kinase MSS4-like protein [Tanacetum coccineum]